MPFRPHPDLMVTDLGDELMLVHARTGEVFRMNGSARAIWQALPGDADGLSAALTEAYEVPQPDAQRDCRAALAEWLQRGVLVES